MSKGRQGSNEKLRILQIISVCNSGGTERMAVELSRTLADRGHDVQMIAPAEGWLSERLAGSKVGFSVMPLRGLERFRTIVSFAMRLRKEPVDVIHSHLARSARTGLAISRLTGIPVVATVHTAKASGLFNRLARGSNRLVAVSGYVRSLLFDWGVPPEYVELIYNGTDFHLQQGRKRDETLAELGIPSGRKIIGFVGRVQKAKGCYELIEAAAQILPRKPNIHLLLVGSDVDNSIAELKERVSACGLSGHVTFAGTQKVMAPYVDSFDIFALPSHKESFGLAALEAMARSKPVIASRIGGLPEVVQDGQTGILVAPGVDHLRDSLELLLDDPALAERMGRKGYELATTRFTLDRMANEQEQVYRSMIRTTELARSELVKEH